jgi:3-oxoacyl-[acyl-carrier-protein] synthase II
MRFWVSPTRPLVARFDPRELRLIARDGEGTMNGMLDVAITGVGVVSAIGLSAEEFHRQLMADASGIRRAPWAADGEGEAVWLATARGFVPRDWMDERVEAGTDLFAQFALAATDQAVRQACLGDLDPLRTGVVHGTSIGGARALMKAQYLLDRDGPQAVPRKTEIQIYPNMAASQIAMRYGLHGPSLTLTTACAASLDRSATRPGCSTQALRTSSSPVAPMAGSAWRAAERTAPSFPPPSTRAGSTA